MRAANAAAMVVALALVPAAALAAPARVAQIGVLSDRDPQGPEREQLLAFTSELRERALGDAIEVVIVTPAGGGPARLAALASQLVAAKVDVIFATTLPAALAARAATARIPIVFSVLPDPVEQGVVASLARPGGNATGIAVNSTALIPKRLQLLREAMPGLARVAILRDPQEDEACEAAWNALREPAAAMGIALQKAEVAQAGDHAGVFDAMVRARVQAVLVPATSRFYNEAEIIGQLAASHHLAFVPPASGLAERDAILSYGPSPHDAYRRAAAYVHRILRGADPATLPVEQPARYELVLNARVARALGIAFPKALRERADRIVE
jgi:putative ABC transport system substrate-binding protein